MHENENGLNHSAFVKHSFYTSENLSNALWLTIITLLKTGASTLKHRSPGRLNSFPKLMLPCYSTLLM